MTTDICDLVRLVSCSCKVGNGADECGVQTETIELTSTIEYVAGGGTISIEIDSELSEESTNPVENRVITRELAKKVNRSDLATINGHRIDEGGNIEIEGGGSYDDTAIKGQLTELSEEVALRNVGAEPTDDSVDEPEIPTPSVSNEWKCVYDGRMEVGGNILEFTTYSDGTPLKAEEIIVQVLIDSASKNNNGYVYVKSTLNQTMNPYGVIDFEKTDLGNVSYYLNQAYLKASPLFMVANLIKNMPSSIASGIEVKGVTGNTAPQIYEDITYVRLVANNSLDVSPLVKIYAR